MATKTRYRFISCLTVLCCGGMLAACDRTTEEPLAEGVEEPELEESTLEQVAEAPESYIGKRVTVAGEVDSISGTRAFELEDNSDVIFEDEVLVLTRSPVRFGATRLADEDHVIVGGVVRQFATAELETELGWDLDPEIEIDDWENKPVIVADNVEKVSGYASWSEREPEGMIVGWTAIIEAPDPSDLVGYDIDLHDVAVKATAGKGVWIGSDIVRLFVEPPPDAPKLSQGQRVDVSGTIRRMPEIEKAKQQWGITVKDAAALADVELYLDAESLQMAEKTQREAVRGEEKDETGTPAQPQPTAGAGEAQPSAGEQKQPSAQPGASEQQPMQPSGGAAEQQQPAQQQPAQQQPAQPSRAGEQQPMQPSGGAAEQQQ